MNNSTCCDKQNLKDLTQGIGEVRNLFCQSWKSHYYDGVFFIQRTIGKGGLMDKDQIEAAKQKAQLVIDGLAKVRDQQARDVLKLVSHSDAQEAKISELRKIIIELRMQKEKERLSTDAPKNQFNDFIKGIYK